MSARRLPVDAQVFWNETPVASQRLGESRLSFVVPEGAESGVVRIEGSGLAQPIFVGRFEIEAQFDSKAAERLLAAERRQSAEKAWKERRAELATSKEERRSRLREREEELRTTRETRRQERVAALRARFDARILAEEQTLTELALHAERRAKLERIRRLAESLNKGKLVVRAEIALSIEDERHEARMAALESAEKEGRP